MLRGSESSTSRSSISTFQPASSSQRATSFALQADPHVPARRGEAVSSRNIARDGGSLAAASGTVLCAATALVPGWVADAAADDAPCGAADDVVCGAADDALCEAEDDAPCADANHELDGSGAAKLADAHTIASILIRFRGLDRAALMQLMAKRTE